MYGIDFGTSNTVVSIESDTGSEVVDLGGGEKVLPSLLYFERDKPVTVGSAAISEYSAALERHRHSRDLYKHFRLFQALKLALKDEFFKGSNIFGKYWTGESLAALFLREVKRRADESCGKVRNSVVLGRPVRLAGDPEKDAAIQNRFRDACSLAGFEEVHFVKEPIAAMASLIGSVKGRTLVFDFGGGTLDITVAGLSDGGIDLLSSEGADLGGYVLDEDLSRDRIIRHFGYGGHIRTMTGKTLEVPHWITNQVASFYALPLGDVVKARQVVRELMYDADRKSELKGLIEFLDRNLAFGLFRMIDDAKIALSSEDSASIAFDVPPHISLHETVTRKDFERIIGKRVATAEALVLKAVADAGIEPGDVAHVVRVGGSSRVPIFVEMLERLFPGKVREGEVYTSISAGLLKAHSLGFSGD